MLEVKDVHLDYDGAVALRGVDLRVARGELVALVGSNGAGKSSLMAGISGLHRPIRGSVRFEGTEISRLPPHKVSGLGIALVPEGRRLFAHLTVMRNLMLGGYRRDRSERRRDLERVFALFPVLSERTRQPAGTLSGGEQQMLALGRALMARPKLLMLDEPSLGVAPKLVARILDVLGEIRASGTTILLVEQDVRAALEMADRGYVLQSGRVVTSGEAEELRESEEVRRAYLGI